MEPVNRRRFLAGLTGLLCSHLVTAKTQDNPENQKEQFDMQLRPHHILDIISDHGLGYVDGPHKYGHSLHLVTPKLLADQYLKIKLVLAADDVCVGCKHLLPDGKCTDVLDQLSPSPSKQAYNDVLDCRLFDEFKIEVNTVMTFREYLNMVNAHVPGIEMICTHPKEEREQRLKGLIAGLTKLGIRKA